MLRRLEGRGRCPGCGLRCNPVALSGLVLLLVVYQYLHFVLLAIDQFV
jgi:hypothetical protein